MTLSVNGGVGAWLGVAALVGSKDGIVQNPEDRRNIALYGSRIVVDGAMRQVIGTVGRDATDVVLTSSWQRLPGATVTLSQAHDANTLICHTAVNITETASAAAVVELGLSTDGATAPAAPGATFSSVTADFDARVPADITCDAAAPVGEVKYLWARATSGAVTIKGTASDSLLGISVAFGSSAATPTNSLILYGSGGNEVGRVGVSSGDEPFFAATGDGDYDPGDGAFLPGVGSASVGGAKAYIEALNDGSGEYRAVESIDGVLVAAQKPAPSWTLSDTDDSVVALTAAWSSISDGGDSLSVATTASEPISANEWVDFHVVLGARNDSSNKAASVAVGVGVDGADPTGSGYQHTLAPSYSGGVVSAVSVQAPAGGWPAGTVFTVYAQKIGSDGTPVVDGTIEVHTLKVSKAGSGGSGASSPTVVQHDQSTDGNSLTIADNTIVELTPDGNPITIDVAAPNVMSQLHILSGPSDITWSGPVAADWPGGSVPDTSTGRHTIGVQRTATQYTMLHQAHQ